MQPWIQMLYDWVAGAALLSVAQKLWPLTRLVQWFIPKEMRDAERTHRILTLEKLQKRIGGHHAVHVDLYVSPTGKDF